jgi:hypothetical protein
MPWNVFLREELVLKKFAAVLVQMPLPRRLWVCLLPENGVLQIHILAQHHLDLAIRLSFCQIVKLWIRCKSWSLGYLVSRNCSKVIDQGIQPEQYAKEGDCLQSMTL